jgi:cytochrome c peroxidase
MLLGLGAMVLTIMSACVDLESAAGPTDEVASTASALTALTAEQRAALALGKERVPEPTNLDQFVKDKAAAIRLGKALFWDTTIGSDGKVACASCHFHAGADSRERNQLNPGTAGGTAVFTTHGPDEILAAADFPFRKLANPADRQSQVLADTKNVAGSQGLVKKTLQHLLPHGDELGVTQPDPIFHVGSENVNQVTGRNSPSVINAVFNHRQFWDGRASAIFNGVSPFGVRDPDARVFRTKSNGALGAVAVTIDNASLASQAVGPLLDPVEMSYGGRTWPTIGRKVLSGRRALQNQMVSPQDSVLGELAASRWKPSNKGLTKTYRQMIQDAFHDDWWMVTDQCVAFDASGSPSFHPAPLGTCASTSSMYDQMEGNFSLFFGLAIQLYEATLVSDQAPIDRYAAGDSHALTPTQQLGLEVFMGKGRCGTCHIGAAFSDATVSAAEQLTLIRSFVFPAGTARLDTGFHNTGVRPNREDVGVGGSDPFGLPLSLTQSSQRGLDVGYPLPPIAPTDFIALHAGSMKAPQLRNVALTGPYMHNGGQATLRQVVEFYNRGGDFLNTPFPVIVPLGLTEAEKSALVELLNALTDPRVVSQSAPFDHPELRLFEGGAPSTTTVTVLPAVGAGGGPPIATFLGLDPQQP